MNVISDGAAFGECNLRYAAAHEVPYIKLQI